MSTHNAIHIEATLLHAGGSAATPIILVENAGRRQARAIKGRLIELAALVTNARWNGPVLIGLGEAFAYARLCAYTHQKVQYQA